MILTDCLLRSFFGKKAHSSLPLVPSFMPTFNTDSTRRNSTDSQAPTPTQANWNHGLSPGSLPFFPSRNNGTQSLAGFISSAPAFDGIPMSDGNTDRSGHIKASHPIGTGPDNGQGLQKSFGRSSVGMQSFGILSGSQEQARSTPRGKVRSWTLSQLGKGKPSKLKHTISKKWTLIAAACTYSRHSAFRSTSQTRTQHPRACARRYGIY